MKRIFVILIIVIGISLRGYNWQNYPFGFDQVQILQNADNILHGKLTLIGPRTGPAPLFTGPFIYYWTAFWLLITSSPYAIVISTVTLSSISGFIFYQLLNKYGKPSNAILGIILWSSSAFLVQLDRVPWNPILSFLAGSLVFIPMGAMINGKQIRRFDMLLIGIGIFLGFQAHFSGLLLLPFAMIGLILTKQGNKKRYLLIVAASALSLLPAFLFDIRHQWLHLKGLTEIINISNPSKTTLAARLFHDLLVSMENAGKFIIYLPSFWLMVGIGTIFFIAFLFVIKQNQKIRLWYLLWLIGIPMIYSFYTGPKPEYYYIIQFPAWIIVIITVINKFSSKIKYALMVIITAINICSAYKNINSFDPLSITRQRDIAIYVNQLGPSKIVYHMPHASTYGLEYLIKLNLESSKEITIEYPKNEVNHYQYQNDFIGVLE